MSEKEFNINKLKELVQNPRIGEILLQRKKINIDQLFQALEIQKERNDNSPIGQILLDMKVISENELVELLSLQSNIDKIVKDSYSELEKLSQDDQE